MNIPKLEPRATAEVDPRGETAQGPGAMSFRSPGRGALVGRGHRGGRLMLFLVLSRGDLMSGRQGASRRTLLEDIKSWYSPYQRI